MAHAYIENVNDVVLLLSQLPDAAAAGPPLGAGASASAVGAGVGQVAPNGLSGTAAGAGSAASASVLPPSQPPEGGRVRAGSFS